MKHIYHLLITYRTVLLYGLIGISAMVVDLCFFLIFYNIFDIPPYLSNIFSVSIATLYAFILNAVYNFKTQDFLHRRFISYVFVSLCGMATSMLIIEIFLQLDIDPNIAKACSLPPVVILQYIINKKVTFRLMTKGKKGGSDSNKSSSEKTMPKSIAIIGGGFTGLTSAYRLAQLGHKVTIYEAEERVGGLVAGFELDGIPLERAYHFLYKTDDAIINLAKEIGVGDTLHFYPSSVSIFFDGKLYPFMTPKDLLCFTPLSFFNRIRAGVIALYLSKVTNWEKFAQVSAYEWMLRWGGKEVTRVIWEPVLRGKFFNYYNTIAMSYLWSRVYVRANSKDKGDITEKLGYFDGGFQTFIKALVARCTDMGVVIHAKTSPSEIRDLGTHVEVVIGDTPVAYDACLTTTPSHVFRKLIEHKNHAQGEVSSTYLHKLTSVPYLGAVLLVFTSHTKLTDYYWHNVNDLNQPFLVMLSLDALVGTEQLKGKHVYYVGAYVPHDHAYFSLTDEEILTKWTGGIKALFPQFTPDMMDSYKIFRFKNAQHIVEPHYQEKILPYQSELPRLYMANFTQIFPDDRGTNYAVAEGIKVADLLHTNLNKTEIT